MTMSPPAAETARLTPETVVLATPGRTKIATEVFFKVPASSVGPAAWPSAWLNAWSCRSAAMSSLSREFASASETLSCTLVVPCSGPLPRAMPPAKARQTARKAKT